MGNLTRKHGQLIHIVNVSEVELVVKGKNKLGIKCVLVHDRHLHNECMHVCMITESWIVLKD